MISSPLTASREQLTAASAKPIDTSFCTRCSSGCHSWKQIPSYKCIHTIKKKNKINIQTHVTLIVKFHIEDKNFSIVKIVTDMQVYDCSIEVPLLITRLYGFSLVVSKTSECFSKRKTKQNSGMTNAKKIVHCMILFFHCWWGKA